MSIRKFNNYDLLKSIAVITMIIDHLGYYFFPKIYIMRVIGRSSALIFALLFGFVDHKKNNKILIFALIMTTLTYIIRNSIIPLNILYNFFLSYFLINHIDKLYRDNYKIFLILLILFLPISFLTGIFIEYGIFFILLIFCGRLINNKKTKRDNKTIISIFILYTIYQIIHFNFNVINSIIVIMIFTSIFIYMNGIDKNSENLLKYLPKEVKKFELKEIEINKYNKILLFISRNSLEIYLFHIFIFELIFELIIF